MADDRLNRGPQDRARINTSEDYEVQYWTTKFGVSREALVDAVDAVGFGSQAVADYLGKRL